MFSLLEYDLVGQISCRGDEGWADGIFWLDPFYGAVLGVGRDMGIAESREQPDVKAEEVGAGVVLTVVS
jgi:hypothetical protein